jgi:UDP:flavonoid glycosyltransferase YjiC (YdhE family)
MGNLLMLRSIPELEGDISHLPHQVHLVGACLPGDEPCLPELETWLQGAAANNEPVIYVHHGRLFDRPHFWSQLVQALAAIKIRIVADVSRMDCSVGALPQNFFAGSYLPQSRILRYAKVVIATPTTTPVLGSLSAGIPSLLIYGAGGEQPTLAQRCKDAGVARTLLSAEASPGRIYAELLALLKDGAVSQAARHMARAFSRAAKTDYATELLERLALTHSMVRGAVTQSSDAS